MGIGFDRLYPWVYGPKDKPISCTGALVFHRVSSPPGPQRPAFRCHPIPLVPASRPRAGSRRALPESISGIVHPDAVGSVIVLGTSSRKTHHSHIRTDDSRKGASILGIPDLPITLAYQLLSTDGDSRRIGASFGSRSSASMLPRPHASGVRDSRNSQIVRARTQTRRRIGRPICLACSPMISSSPRRQ